MPEHYLGIITPDEIESLRNARQDGWTHPVAALALADPAHQVAANTSMAGRSILLKSPDWMRGLRSRLLATDDFTHAASALGEIRAHGALIETWMPVVPAPQIPGSQASPEFEVDSGAGPVIVEVHCRQLDHSQVAALARHDTELAAASVAALVKARAAGQTGNVVTSGVIEVFPAGAPVAGKPGDSVLTNTISRVARIKENEHQIDPAKPFVLWLDFQDPHVWGGAISDEQFSPLYTEMNNGAVGCGALWHALYGRKDAPLLESRGYDYRSSVMLHEGRFRQTMKSHGGPTRVSAVVYSLPRATIMMENPAPANPIPPGFRAAILKAPFFRLDLSLIEWKLGLVSDTIELQHRSVGAAVKALEAFDP
jgi:hypothetical protein